VVDDGGVAGLDFGPDPDELHPAAMSTAVATTTIARSGLWIMGGVWQTAPGVRGGARALR